LIITIHPEKLLGMMPAEKNHVRGRSSFRARVVCRFWGDGLFEKSACPFLNRLGTIVKLSIVVALKDNAPGQDT
jgi:hypothetical protein